MESLLAEMLTGVAPSATVPSGRLAVPCAAAAAACSTLLAAASACMRGSTPCIWLCTQTWQHSVVESWLDNVDLSRLHRHPYCGGPRTSVRPACRSVTDLGTCWRPNKAVRTLQPKTEKAASLLTQVLLSTMPGSVISCANASVAVMAPERAPAANLNSACTTSEVQSRGTPGASGAP